MKMLRVDDQTGKNKIKVTNLTDSLLLGYGIFKEVSTDVFTQIATIDYTQEEYIDETSTPPLMLTGIRLLLTYANDQGFSHMQTIT